MFVDVREPRTGKLLFRFDAERDLIEIAERGVRTVVDLSQYRQAMHQPRPRETISTR